MGESRGGGCLRVVLVVMAVLVGLAAVGVAALAYWWHRLTTPPDVASVARSPAVDQAARQAAGVIDPGLAAAVSTAPWLTPVADGVEDICRTDSSPFLGGGWSPVTCTRTATRILAADDGDAARGLAWDRALRGAGWAAEDRAVAEASAGPPGEHSYTHTATGVALTVTWVRSPTDPVPGLDPPPYRDSKTEFFRAEQRPDEAAVRAAYARSRYLVVLTASRRYHDPTLQTTPPPAPVGGCRDTDSARCPGG